MKLYSHLDCANSTIFSKRLMRLRQRPQRWRCRWALFPSTQQAPAAERAWGRAHTLPVPHAWTQYCVLPDCNTILVFTNTYRWSDIGPKCQPRISCGPQAQRKGSILALEEKLANTGLLNDGMSISSVAISSGDVWPVTIHNFDLSLTL